MTTIEKQESIWSFRSADLDQIEYGRIVALIRDLYIWFAPDSKADDIHKRLYQHPAAIVDLLLNESGDMCEGFSVHYTEAFQGHNVMFRGGTVVRHRSKGHYRSLLEHSILGSELDYIVAMTQNPRVYETLRSFSTLGYAYPDVSGCPIPQTAKDIAEHFCKVPIADIDTMQVRNVYGDIRKDEEFKTGRDPAVVEMFRKNLGRDDGYFVVVPMK